MQKCVQSTNRSLGSNRKDKPWNTFDIWNRRHRDTANREQRTVQPDSSAINPPLYLDSAWLYNHMNHMARAELYFQVFLVALAWCQVCVGEIDVSSCRLGLMATKPAGELQQWMIVLSLSQRYSHLLSSQTRLLYYQASSQAWSVSHRTTHSLSSCTDRLVFFCD